MGFSDEEAEHLDRVRPGPGGFELPRLLGLWQQWVDEVERGKLWVDEDVKAAWAARDDLDDALVAAPPHLRDRLCAVVDPCDYRFRNATVSSRIDDRVGPERWWRGRTPINNKVRLFLFNRGS